MHEPLILASSSAYRQSLLSRLGLQFSAQSPAADESIVAGESPRTTALRLSALKARSIAASVKSGIIIGSDQVAELKGRAIGKPGHKDAAREQLQNASGETLLFHTGLCVLNAASGRQQLDCVTTTVQFRKLEAAEIEAYLRKEDALDCAGSFKAEGLGITLFESLTSEDPTALIGLPLIRLVTFLREEGINPLMQTSQG